jgi:hypothetical protein
VGDCNTNREVTIGEIILMVNLALGVSSTDCAEGDPNASGHITIDEILSALNNALRGCPP